MRILVISTRFPPHIGGVEEVVEKLAKSLAQKNEVRVVASLNLSDLVSSKTSAKFKSALWKFILGFKISEKDSSREYDLCRYWLNFPRSIMGYISMPYRFTFSMLALIRDVRKFNPDVINYHFPDDSSLYLYVLSIFTKTPVVLNIHGNDLHVYSKKFPHRFFIKSLVRRSCKIIVNSNYMKKEFLKVFKGNSRKVVIVPNSIEVETIQKIKPRKYFPEDYIFYVGRMVHKKGVDVLLKAFSMIEHKDVRLLIEGKGESLEHNIELAKDLDLGDRVFFAMGRLNYVEKTAHMKAAKVGVIPSRIEPFGIVALEMLAAGIPIIASKTGGLEDILKDKKTTIFFKNGDPVDLAKQIDFLLNNEQLMRSLVENGLKEISKYRLKNITKKYLEVYKACA